MRRANVVSIAVSAILALGACGERDRAAPAASNQAAVADAPASPASATDLGDRWVAVEVSTERSSPDGPVVNRVYYGQKLTTYERRGDWYRTVEDGFEPRWTKADDLTSTKPAEKPAYSGPAGYQDARIEPDAIPNPGQYGLTKRDVDDLWKGATMVLRERPDCSQITTADKSVRKPNTYYVTCRMGGVPENVFFTRAEAEAALAP
jgi:hypothetical protein